MSEIAGLRYSFKDDVLRIEEDTPYLHTYKIDYLNIVRTTSSNVQNSSTVANDENDAGSDFSASNDSEADFWGELDEVLIKILDMRDSAGRLKTFFTPQLRAVVSNPGQVAPVVAQGPDGVTVSVAPPSANIQVNSLPTDSEEMVEDEEDIEAEDLFSINRNAGLITVFATQRKHKEVEDYLHQLKVASTSQVLIEAKVMEIILTDEFQAGVDWGEFAPNDFLNLDLLAAGTADVVNGSSVRVGRASTNNINATVQALQTFGTVRALASPRLTVLNNQSAVLNVSKNLVYFEFEVEIAEGDEGEEDRPIVTSQIETAPEGILINVQPVIDLKNRSISMAVRPTVTRASSFVSDPTLGLNFGTDPGVEIPDNRIPEIQIQEFDSLIELQDGQVAILGGLLSDRITSDDSGVPVLSEVPLLGNLFKNQSDTISKTELVVLLKATIIDRGDSNVQQKDRELYRKMSSDRRPFGL
jgi:general secretion pathway protein D